MKKKIDLVRAWRDEDYYLSLTEEERAGLGAHPSGAAGVSDNALRSISGGCGGKYPPYGPGESPCLTNCGMDLCTVCW
ncbi:MAG TPA: mersacidin/lichenicidin family type 2 lantibiotic [Thermoanaerobaculia bacterium]|nr:mersacidin/lichenicidin family type 2 lantibiotic [Thermoanaerobaculia bacterium]